MSHDYYILHKEDNELSKLTIAEYFGYVSTGSLGEDILILYNKSDRTISSMQDISKYWFHIINGRLFETVNTTREQAERTVSIFIDYGRDLQALSHYNTTINDNIREPLTEGWHGFDGY